MATQPLGNPKFRAFDSNGNPLSGGKLYSYEAGTTTQRATYTTRAGDVANANPVILDANGEADVWMTPGVLYKFVLHNSADVQQFSVDNYPSPADPDTTYDVATDPGGRLTLETGVPVSTSDQSGKTTVYYTPHKHNRIPIYNGSEWVLETFDELSQTTTDTTKSPAAVANNSNYDLFVWNDSGTIRLSRGPAWTSDTGRGTGAGTTELEKLNGRYVNKVSITNGPAANRGTYVGSVRSNSSAQIDHTAAKRFVDNAYHQEDAHLGFSTNFGSYSYTSSTVRQANGNSSYRVEMLNGLPGGKMVRAEVRAYYNNSTVGALCRVGLGLDSTTTASSYGGSGRAQVAAYFIQLQATFCGAVGLGYHALNWLESSQATGTGTWDASGAATSGMDTLAGITGIVRC